jgi:hypothetical protein
MCSICYDILENGTGTDNYEVLSELSNECILCADALEDVDLEE